MSICLLFALSTLLVVPSGASAAPSSVSAPGGIPIDSSLFVTAGGDSTSHAIDVSYSGGAYLVTDSAGAVAGTGCVQDSSASVSCPDNGLTGIAMDGGAGADKLTIASVGPAVTDNGIFGGGGNDTITGSELRDLIRGNEGDDTIDGGLGPDNILGGPGTDTVTYASRPASQPVKVTLENDPDQPVPDGASSGAEGDSLDIENLVGTPGNDVLIGFTQEGFHESSLANTFRGGAGNDRLAGGAGADKLFGESGKDKLLGGAQKDTLVGGASKDRCVGGPSKDKDKQCESKAGIP